MKKTRVKLYPDIEEDGFFEPPEEISNLIEQIELAIINDSLDDSDIAKYEVIEQLLAAPTGMFLITVQDILKNIIDSAYVEAKEKTEEDQQPDLKLITHKPEEKPAMSTHNVFTQKPKEDPEVPISLADLDEWYRKTPGIITGFYNADHMGKYRLYLAKLEEIELEGRDLTDEELWKDLEGPEQSD